MFLQWMTHHIIPMHVLAELVVHSYPYKADIHMTLQVRLKRPPFCCPSDSCEFHGA